MNKIFTIAKYTFIEMVRHKILYALFFFALFIIVLGIAITQMTIGDTLDIISDIGLGTIEIFSTILAIFMGIVAVQRELKLKTLHPLLARPVARTQYIIGKFFGMLLIILAEIFLMMIVFALLLLFFDGFGRIITFMPALYTIFLQTSMIVAISVFCSSMTEPAVGAMISISYYIIGATSYNLIYLISKRSSEATVKIVTALRYVLPDFHYFNIKDNLVYKTGLESINISYATFYALANIVIIISLAIIFFNRKEIN